MTAADVCGREELVSVGALNEKLLINKSQDQKLVTDTSEKNSNNAIY